MKCGGNTKDTYEMIYQRLTGDITPTSSNSPLTIIHEKNINAPRSSVFYLVLTSQKYDSVLLIQNTA